MKAILQGILSITVLVVGGALLYYRLQPSLQSATKQAPSEIEAAFRNPPAANSEGKTAVINEQRLRDVAGTTIEGMSYMVTEEEHQKMVAEQRQRNTNRLPANEAPVQSDTKKKTK